MIPGQDPADAEYDRLKERVEQLEVQLAGCGVAALGYATGENAVEKGSYGWSASYGDVVELRAEVERLRGAVAISDAIAEELKTAKADRDFIDAERIKVVEAHDELAERVMAFEASRILIPEGWTRESLIAAVDDISLLRQRGHYAHDGFVREWEHRSYRQHCDALVAIRAVLAQLPVETAVCQTCEGRGFYMVNAHDPQEMSCQDCLGSGRRKP